MTMAQNYRNASMTLDRINGGAKWARNTKISSHQRDVYLSKEEKAHAELSAKYPHKYVAAKVGNAYDVKKVFADGSELPCPALTTELDIVALRESGAQIEEAES